MLLPQHAHTPPSAHTCSFLPQHTHLSTQVEGCKCCGDQFEWHEQDVNRTDAAGVAERRVVAQREGKRLGDQLADGMWIAVQDRSKTDVYWIGQAFAIPGKKEGNPCHYTICKKRSEWIAGTEFTRGDIAAAVKWWVKTTTDPEELTFEQWQPTEEDKEKYGIEMADGEYYFIFNCTELRHIRVNVVLTVDAFSAPQIIHRTRRASSVPAATVSRIVRLPADEENQILAKCW